MRPGKQHAIALTLFGIAAWAGPGRACAQSVPSAASAAIYDGKGEQVGQARFTEVHGVGAKMVLDVAKLAPGPHGLHIDAVGKCQPPDFKSAGPHFNPWGKEHGLRNPSGPHAGDLEDIVVGPDGKAHVEILDPRFSLSRERPDSLFHSGGSSVVIDAGPDNQAASSSESSVRVACGVIQADRWGSIALSSRRLIGMESEQMWQIS
jgi:superoxide dismutase, Cu-Zn family